MIEDITGEEIKRQFKTNKKVRWISIGIGALVVLALGYFLYRQFVVIPNTEKSKDNYWIGLNYAAKDSSEVALDELRSHKKKYDGYVGGEVAQFVYARQLMNQGEFQNAIKELEEVELEDTYARVFAVGLIADCYSEMGKYENAANKYLEAANLQDDDVTTPMYLFKAGLSAEEIKNFEEATECYQRIKDDYPTVAAQKQIDKLSLIHI